MMISRRKCFNRFNQNILDEGLHKKNITMEEYGLIQKFWNSNMLYNIEENHIDILKSYNLQCKVYENGLKITSFPHLKEMCLKVCKKNPKLWKYEDELNGNFLFGLIISTDGCRVITSENELQNLI